MISRKPYVDNLYVAEYGLKESGLRQGAYVECGTWRGGMSFGIMETCPRLVECHFFDSFEGLPKPGALDGERARIGMGTDVILHDDNSASYEEFLRNVEPFRRGRDIQVHRGWFEETLPGFRSEHPIAILRLDGDWYDSTMTILRHLFDQVADGGIILIDDYYHWEGCSRAVHDFLSERKAIERIEESPNHRVAYLVRRRPESDSPHLHGGPRP